MCETHVYEMPRSFSCVEERKPASAWVGGELQITSLLVESQYVKAKNPLQQGWEAGSWVPSDRRDLENFGYAHTPGSPAMVPSEQQVMCRNVCINGKITVSLRDVKATAPGISRMRFVFLWSTRTQPRSLRHWPAGTWTPCVFEAHADLGPRTGDGKARELHRSHESARLLL